MDLPSQPKMTIARPKQRRTLDPAVALELMQQHERKYQIKAWTALLVGILLVPLGPLIINSLIWMMYQGTNVIFRGKFDKGFGFWKTYWIVAVISLPILFLLAWLIEGSPVEAAAEGDSVVWGAASVPLALVELGNIGPRLIFSSVRRRRRRRELGHADLQRLSMMVARLAECEEAVPPTILLQQGETRELLPQVLPLLQFYELVDVSKKGDRVWLHSVAKRRLGVE